MTVNLNAPRPVYEGRLLDLVETVEQASLVYSPHPLLAKANRIVECAPFAPGESIAAYLERVGIRFGSQPVALCLNGELITREEWSLTVPKQGDLITVRALTRGGDGSDVKRIVLFIAVAIAAAYTGGVVGAQYGVVAGSLAQAAVMIGGTLLINAILPPPTARLSGIDGRNESSPTYALRGGSNRARPYEPLPLLFGKHRIWPDAGAQPYTEFEGDDQYLYQVFNFGLADMELSDIRIGDTPIDVYTGVTVEVSGDDGALSLFPTNVDSQAGGALTAAVSWVTRNSSPDAVQLAVEIVGNLFYTGDNGIEQRQVTLEVEYRAVGASTWLPFFNSNTINSYATHYWSAGRSQSFGYPLWVTKWVQVNYGSTDPNEHTEGEPYGTNGDFWSYIDYKVVFGQALTGEIPTGAAAPKRAIRDTGAQITIQSASRNPLRKTYTREVPRGQYEVRARRTTADETDVRAVSDIVWSQLRTYQPDDTDYTGQLRMAVKIKASGQLQGIVDRLSAVGTAREDAFDGTDWTIAETSNPAWHILKLARGKTINGRRAFGAGLPDSRIDIANLTEFAQWCHAQGLTFDGVFDRQESVKEMMDAIARCGRGSTSWQTGKLGVVWDAPNLPVSAVFGMSNIRRNTFEVNYVTERLADEIVVNFVNPDLDWQQDQVRALVPGVTQPSTEARVDLFGCTNKDMAGRDANLLAAQQKYRRRMISWETDMEGLVVGRGDAVSLSHDLTQWGYSGRLVAGTTTQLTLDREVPFTPATDHYIGIVFPNGDYQIYDVTFQAGPSDVIDLATALPSAPDADPDHPPMDYKWLFDPKPTPGKRVKIFSVQPLSEYHARLTAFDDDDAFYLNENAGFIYLSPGKAASRLPKISSVALSETLLRVGTGWAVKLTITWDVSGDYSSALIRAGVDGAQLEQVGGTFGRRVDITVPASGTVDLEVTLFDAQGRYSDDGRYTTTHIIIGKDAPPPDVAEFTIQGNRLAWSKVNVVDLSGYVIRFHYGARRSFDDAQPLHEGVLTESPYDMLIRPEGAVTLMIKAVDTSGNFSDAAAVIITDLGDALTGNIVQTFDLKTLAWPGTITNGTIDGSDNVIADETTLFYNSDDSAAFYDSDSVDLYPAANYAQLTYETDEISLTEASDGSVLSLPYSIAGVSTQILWRRVGPNAFYSETASDPMYGADPDPFFEPAPAYTPWTGPVLPLREVVQFKVITAQGGVQGVISDLVPTLDMPDIIERIDDFAVAAPGARLPITKTYRAIRNVSLTLQDDGGNATTAKVFDKNVTLGPLVQCFDGAAGVAGLVDATIQGY